MKRIWVALFLLLFSLSFALSEFFLVKHSYQKHLDMLTVAEIYFSQKEYNDTYEQCKAVEKSWDKSKKFLNVFLVHKQVEEVSQSLLTLKNQAKAKDDKAFLLTIDKTKRQLLSIKESELPDYENIL